MNELVEILGLRYGVKFYVNRSDRYTSKLYDLSWNDHVRWDYACNTERPMVIIYLYKPMICDIWNEY